MISDNDAINNNSKEDKKEQLLSDEIRSMRSLTTDDKILFSETLDFIQPHGNETILDFSIINKGFKVLKSEITNRKFHVIILVDFINRLDNETISKLKDKYTSNNIDLYIVLILSNKQTVDELNAKKLSIHEGTFSTSDTSNQQDNQGAFMRILLAEHIEDIAFIFDQLNIRLNLTLNLLPYDEVSSITRSFWFSIGLNTNIPSNVWKLIVSNLRYSISLMKGTDQIGCCVFNTSLKVIKELKETISKEEKKLNKTNSTSRFEEAYPLTLKPQLSHQHSQMNSQAASNCCTLLGRTVIAAIFAGVIIVILKLIGVI